MTDSPEPSSILGVVEQLALSSAQCDVTDPALDTERAYVSEPLVIDTEVLSDLESFVAEAQEHIDAIEAGLLDLAQAPDSRARLDEVFRAFHTIKGVAGFLNLRDVNSLAHHAEAMLDKAREGALSLTPDHIDLIFSTADLLKKQVQSIAAHLETPTARPVPQPRIAEVLDQLRHAASPDEEATGPSPATPAPPQAHRRASESSESHSAGTQKALAVRVDTAKLDSLLEVVGELVIAQTSLSQDPALEGHAGLSSDNISRLTKLVREVQEITMSLRMVSLRQTFRKMDRLTRDLARKSGKQVDFTCSGEDTELDKSVIDAIGGPLMHMVRNAMDHGIELPEERVAAGKPQQGHIHLHAAHQGGSILIEVADDGRGLDRDELIQEGIRRGLVSPNETLSEEQALGLIMQPGFSTAHTVTDVSGRGVGMDVVRRNIDSLRGRVEIHSQKGKGCTIRIRLPLTLAILDGMVARVDESRFVIPMAVIDRLLRPRKDQVFAVHKRGEMLQVRGRLCPLMRLDALLNVRPERPPAWEGMVAVVHVDGGRVGLVVDDLVGQQQVVIKTLGDSFKHLEGISGATILGDGTVGLILDASGLVSIHERNHAA